MIQDAKYNSEIEKAFLILDESSIAFDAELLARSYAASSTS